MEPVSYTVLQWGKNRCSDSSLGDAVWRCADADTPRKQRVLRLPWLCQRQWNSVLAVLGFTHAETGLTVAYL